MDTITEATPKKRGRKPKAPVETTREQEEAPTNPAKDKTNALRDGSGLLRGVNYVYDELGFVDWRQMVNKKHVVLNRNSAAKMGIDLFSITEDEKQKYLNEWPDDKKVIRLAGFREVARLRGYYSVEQRVTQEGDKVVAHCTIHWMGNYEGPAFRYTTSASASPSNVAPDFIPFLEAVACNRAFGRAVRESLNINVVADEELNPTEKVEVATPFKLQAAFKQKCQEKGVSFDTVLEGLRGQNLTSPDWVSWETLPIAAVNTAFGLLTF